MSLYHVVYHVEYLVVYLVVYHVGVDEAGQIAAGISGRPLSPACNETGLRGVGCVEGGVKCGLRED